MSSASTAGTSDVPRRRRRLSLLLFLSPFLILIFWEFGHRARFGDFFSYGYHVDLVLDKSDVGVPRQHPAHCLRVANYTFSVLKFEVIQTPQWGITDGAVLFHDRIDKWSEQTHSWQVVGDSVTDADPSLRAPNATKNVWPGRSIYPTGCYEMATVEGVHKGDVVRLVAFTSYSKPPSAPSQRVFYSPAFTVQDESLKNLAGGTDDKS
jgi:hypothetical protein